MTISGEEVPAIPDVLIEDADLRNILLALKTIAEIREGRHKDTGQRFITYYELVDYLQGNDQLVVAATTIGHNHDSLYSLLTHNHNLADLDEKAYSSLTGVPTLHSDFTDDEPTKHRLINDSGTSTTELWSADKLITQLALKSDTTHNHNLNDLTEKAYSSLTGVPTLHSDFTDDEPTKHRLINDAGTLTTELFSASKILADLATKSATTHNHNLNDLTEKAYSSLTGVPTLHSDFTDDEAAKHRLINDSGTLTTELWSASKLIAQFALKSATTHNHNLNDLSEKAYSSLTGVPTLHSDFTDDEAVKHRLINDAGTLLTELWSANKINAEFVSTNGVVATNSAHVAGDGSDHADVAANTALAHAQAHTLTSHSDIVDATGAQVEELTGGGDTTLHDHAGISENSAARHAEAHTVASHSDTTATGAELNTLTGGGDTTLHDHDGISENTTHRSSNGSDHTFIDQNVAGGASPTFTATNITGLPDGGLASGATVVSTGAPDSGKLVKLDAGGKVDATVINLGDISHDSILDVSADDHHPQLHTVASHSDTTATGAQLNTLVGGGDTTLHDHAGISENTTHRTGDGSDHADVAANTALAHAEAHTVASHSDTTATGAELNALTGGGDTTLHDHDGISENTAARHAQAHTVASHSDTTATGAELETLTNGSDADALHDHDGISENNTHRAGDGSDHADVAANTSLAHAQAHTVASHSDTTATGAELNTLTGGGDTTLHDHAGISENTTHRSSDGKNHSDVVLNNTHRAGDGSDHADVAANTAAKHAQAHTVASHSDTTATGAELNTLTGGGDTNLHEHNTLEESASGLTTATAVAEGITIKDSAGSYPHIWMTKDDDTPTARITSDANSIDLGVWDDVSAYDNILIGVQGSSVNIYYNDGLALRTQSDGASMIDTAGTNPAMSLRSNADALQAYILSTTTELLIKNEINSAHIKLTGKNNVGTNNLMINADPDSGVELKFKGGTTFYTCDYGAVVQDNNGGAPTLYFFSASDVQHGYLWFSNSHLYIKNQIHGGGIRLSGENNATGAEKMIFEGDPDGAAYMYHAGVACIGTEDGTSVPGGPGTEGGITVWSQNQTYSASLTRNNGISATLCMHDYGDYWRFGGEDSGGGFAAGIVMLPHSYVQLNYNEINALQTTADGVDISDTSGSIPIIDMKGDDDTSICTLTGAAGTDIWIECQQNSGDVWIAGTNSSGSKKWIGVAASDPSLRPSPGSALSLGVSAARWTQLYADTATIDTSDIRLKIVHGEGLGLDFIRALRPVTYQWKTGIRPHQGLIAQEVKKTMTALGIEDFGGYVDPYVTEHPEGEENWKKKRNGDKKPHLALRYGEFISPLIKAVQEQQDQIETLMDEIKKLKGLIKDGFRTDT